jgi:hypothetical protein
MTQLQDDPTRSLFGSTLVLRDNDWDECTIDHLKGQWRKLTQQGARGFCQLPAGRHQVITAVQGEPVVLDCTLYPGETLVRRLDSEAKQWVLDDLETERRYLELASGGRFGAMSSALVDYSRVVLAVRQSPPSLLSNETARQVCEAFLKLHQRLSAGEPLPSLLSDAHDAGLTLVGEAMLASQLSKMVGLFAGTASSVGATGNFGRAGQLTMIALAILPGEPWLLDLMANLYSDTGRPDLGMPLIEEALRRASLYPENVQSKMRETLAEVAAALPKG